MSALFPEAILNAIPAELREVPEKVRALTGIEVVAAPFDEAFIRANPDFARASAVLDIDPRHTSITIRFARDALNARIASHELIHLKRNVLESAPKFFPQAGAEHAQAQTILLLENALEHLFVVPEEIAAHADSEAWWVRECAEAIRGADGHGFTLALHWLFLRQVLTRHEDLAHDCAARLNRAPGFARIAAHLEQQIRKAFPDKAAMQQILLGVLSPAIRERITVARYQIRDGRLHTERLALPD
ncbi:hypothetical protein [Niveibacterium terrae]|uniref:hypothetical protein n=1 Tax=Niveibacterium terrae TaxID=3373598 RepID=UPI003A901F99